MKDKIFFSISLLVVAAVAVISAMKTDVLRPFLGATAASSGTLSCSLKSDSASPPNTSIKSITGGTGNYECNFPEEESSGFPIYSSASCSASHPSNCTGIGTCPVVATVRDVGVKPNTYVSCMISVTGEGIPVTGCPSGFSLVAGQCVGSVNNNPRNNNNNNNNNDNNNNTSTTVSLPQFSNSVGQINFEKVFFDSTNLVTTSSYAISQRIKDDGTYLPQVQDMKIARFGSKTFLFLLTGGAIKTYDLADPFNPKYVGSTDLYSQTVEALSSVTAKSQYPSQPSRWIFQNMEIIDNFNYGIMFGSSNYNPGSTNPITVFKINPNTGVISYVNFYNNSNNPYGFYSGDSRYTTVTVGSQMKLFSQGGKVYLVTYANDKNYNPSTGGAVDHLVSIFDFTNPESNISLLYQLPGIGDVQKSKDGSTSYYPIDIYGFNIVNSGGKNYLFVTGDAGSFYDNDFGFVHSGTEWTFIFDLSNPSNPKQIVGGKGYQLYGWFDYMGGRTGLAMNNITNSYIFDPITKNFYVTSGITQGNSLMGRPINNFDNRFNLAVMDFSTPPTFKKISDITLRRGISGEQATYAVVGPDPLLIRSSGGFIDFEYMAPKNQVVSTSTDTGVYGAHQASNINNSNCRGNQFALMGVEKNGTLTYIADPNNELDKAKDNIKNQSSIKYDMYNSQDIYCLLSPSAVAILPVDSKTVAVYRGRTFYAEADKVSLTSASSYVPPVFTPITTTGTGIRTVISTSSVPSSNNLNFSIFSFQNLLNIFKKIGQ